MQNPHEATSLFAKVRAWLNGPGSDKLPIVFQCFISGYLLFAIVAASISAGSFPPKKIDDPLILLAIGGIVVWFTVAFIAGLVILLKRAWGWWLEFALAAVAAVAVLIYTWFGKEITLASFEDWIQLFGAIMMTLMIVPALKSLYAKCLRETGLNGQTKQP